MFQCKGVRGIVGKWTHMFCWTRNVPFCYLYFHVTVVGSCHLSESPTYNLLHRHLTNKPEDFVKQALNIMKRGWCGLQTAISDPTEIVIVSHARIYTHTHKYTNCSLFLICFCTVLIYFNRGFISVIVIFISKNTKLLFITL